MFGVEFFFFWQNFPPRLVCLGIKVNIYLICTYYVIIIVRIIAEGNLRQILSVES